jgi:hypothetical protein
MVAIETALGPEADPPIYPELSQRVRGILPGATERQIKAKLKKHPRLQREPGQTRRKSKPLDISDE